MKAKEKYILFCIHCGSHTADIEKSFEWKNKKKKKNEY